MSSFARTVLVLGLLLILSAEGRAQTQTPVYGGVIGGGGSGTNTAVVCFGGTGTALIDCLTPNFVSTATGVGIGIAAPLVDFHVVGDSLFQSSVDSATGLQILDADGGAPILNVDTINERVGIGVASPVDNLDVRGSVSFQSTSDSTDAFQILDFDGGTPVFNCDTVNERCGIGTATPLFSLHVSTTEPIIQRITRSAGTVASYDFQIGDIGAGAGQLLLDAATNDTGFAFRPKSSGGSLSTGLFLDPNGNAGFGTAAPGTALHLSVPTPILRFQDSNGAGNAAVVFMEFFDSTIRQGFFGFGSSSNSVISLFNEVTGGDIVIQTTATGNIILNSKLSAQPGGDVPTCELYTVAFTDLTTASTTEAEVLFNLPARGVITGLKVKHSVAFTGTGPLTAMTVSVGDTAPADDVAYTSTFDIFAAVSNTLDQDTPFFGSSTFVADDVQANFIATGGNMDDLTAGSVDFMVCWAVLP